MWKWMGCGKGGGGGDDGRWRRREVNREVTGGERLRMGSGPSFLIF